jgi:hypothetical protein
VSAEDFEELHRAVHVLFSRGYLNEVQSQNLHGKIGLDESRVIKAALEELKPGANVSVEPRATITPPSNYEI